MEIAVISGKGGTGKSCISAAFATQEKKVLIADCDVDAANLYLLFKPTIEYKEVYIAGYKAVINYERCTNCGKCIDYCRFDSIHKENGKVTISEILCDGCSLCSRICPENAIEMLQNNKSRMFSGSFRNGKMVYGRLAPGEENSGKLVNIVRQKAKQVAEENNLEIVILDGPPGIGCPVISTITGVDKVIIITEPTISGFRDLQRTLEVVKKFNLECCMIINKFDLNKKMSIYISKRCKEIGINVTDYLPFDVQVVEAMVNCKSITEWNPELVISKRLKKIWNDIISKNN